MVDKTRRVTRRDAENGIRIAPHPVLRVTLPTFAVLVLRHRAKEQHLSVSAVVETLILDGVMLDEVECLMKQSPEFARTAVEWMRSAGMRKRR
jgi:hypothetical protein